MNINTEERFLSLSEHKEMFTVSQKLAHIGSWEYIIETGIVIWSDEVFRIFGYEVQSFELTIEKFYENLPEKDIKKVSKMVDLALNNIENPNYNISHYLNNGKYVEERGIAIFDKGGKAIRMIGTVQDITIQHEKSLKIKEQKKIIEHQTFHDTLTGLPNRAMFFEQLKSSINFAERYKKELGVLFIDLDRFKEINDTYGHDAGDEILIEVGVRLKSIMRKDDLVFRLGGDEFVLINFDVDSMMLEKTIGNKILDSFKKPFEIQENFFYLTCSIGISTYPKDSTDHLLLLKFADTAMYKAKDNGKNTIAFYSPKLTEQAFERIIMETSLRNAINKNEFVVYYQPQYECNTHKIIGSEALVRWKHPDLGIIPPLKFIPLAEETGMILEIGEIVLKKACLQVTEWYSQGYNPGKVAVNLAGKQILDIDLISKVKNILNETGCKPEWLELEITESFIMQDIDISKENLKKLRLYGIELSIDDFGTGYSSLSHLKKLPISKIKIDQSFIRDIENNEDDKTIVSAIIAMSSSLGLITLAEGIETEKQKDFLSLKGCNSGQGYLFSKPIPPDQFVKLLIS